MRAGDRAGRAAPRAAVGGLAALLVLAAAALPSGPGPAPDTLAFRDVRVFDGDSVLPEATVLVRGDTVAAVGSDVRVPSGERATVVDGDGRTLLPGLIDAHAHTFARRQLERAAVFGVTTQLDMATNPSFLRRMREGQRSGEATDRADVFGAGYPATAPGGHGTQFGMDVPPLRGPDGAGAWVERRAEEGADWIKVIRETGGGADTTLPTLEWETVRGVVSTAHDRELPVVVHASTLGTATRAVAAGADGLTHVWRDRVAPDSAVRRLREAGVFVIPTLAVIESVTLGRGGPALAADPALRPYLLPYTRKHLERTAAAGEPSPGEREAWEAASTSTLRLWRAGVPVLAGTDTPNPGVSYGASLHRELELLVRAGLPERAALAAATSAPAEALGLEGRGRIVPGSRADLLLVEGDPTADVTRTRNITGVWKAGERIPRETVGPAETDGRSGSEGGSGRPGETPADTAGGRSGATRLAGSPGGPAERALWELVRASGPRVREGALTVPPGDTASGFVAVEGPVRIRGHVRGSVGAVDARVRLAEGGSVRGDLIVLGGRLYRSAGATVRGRLRYEPGSSLRARRRGERWVLRADAAGGALLEPAGVAGVRMPRYQRVDGLSPGVGVRLALPAVDGDPVLRLDSAYRTASGRPAGTVRLDARPGEAWRLGLEAGRGTRSGERWIRDDPGNSLAFALGGDDLRNYHGSDRLRLELRRRLTPSLRLRLAAGWEQVRSLSARSTGVIPGGGTPRPNPAVDEGEGWPVTLSGRYRTGGGADSLSVRLGVEGASASAAGDFSYLLLRARAETSVSGPGRGRLRLRVRGRRSLAEGLPRHLWSALGGTGTIATAAPLSMRGSSTLFARLTYSRPLAAVGEVLGRSPSLRLRSSLVAVDGPGDGDPVARHTLGAGLRLSVLGAGLVWEPAAPPGGSALGFYVHVHAPG